MAAPAVPIEVKLPEFVLDPVTGRYHAIDKYGIPRIGAYIRQGDCIIGKVRTVSASKGEEARPATLDYDGITP